MRIAIDTGGTFTDCVYFADHRLQVLKIPSTPADPGEAVLTAVSRITSYGTADVRHGTTVGTNALLERKGARVAFVTTAGFEDTIAIGRQARPKLYDLFFTKEESLAPEDLRFGVSERISSEGTVLRELTDSELSRLRDQIADAAPEAVAVSLLFSFANPENERRVVSALRALGVPVSASHEILPEFREFERGSTVLINAYLAPKMETYIRHLDKALAAKSSSLHVMQSSGGIIPAAVAAREPVRTVLSGAAGGVVGALAIGRNAGFGRLLTFDMGGTSTDVALVDSEAGLRTTTESMLLGLPIAVPMLNIHTVGAGGGSLASFDLGGALKVGPESAGADPGPICYGRGEQSTVTDANLVLGRLDAESFLGGGMKLDEARARYFMETSKGSLLSVEQLAEGIVRVADSHMQRALRHISVEGGHDPRDFTLVSFGGAGPLHACSLAQSLQIPRVLVPPMPGALSAYGILVSDAVRDFSRTVMLGPADESLKSRFDDLEVFATCEMQREGLTAVPIRTVDLRYAGQGYELTVDWSPDFVSKFHQVHGARYGYADSQRKVEVVNLRVRMIAAAEPIPIERIPQARSSDSRDAVLKQTRIFYEGDWMDGAVYDRQQLQAGHQFQGPAIVVEYSGTTFIPPGCHARVDEYANILVSLVS